MPELGVIEALVLVRANKCRVTYGDEVIVEAWRDACGPECGGSHHVYGWIEVARAPSFVEAATLAKEVCRWK